MIRKFLFFLAIFAGLTAVQAQQPTPPIRCDCVLPPGVTADYHRVTIDVVDMIATTTVEMQFTNRGEGLAEGQFLFPLPQGAAVQQLVMYVNGQAIEANILRADEARAIYDEIVRQYRDPALLEYVGRDLIQANVFPIPARESRQIKIVYGQALTIENNLVKVLYPLRTPITVGQLVGQVSVRVTVTDNSEIGNVYSPSHAIALSRPQPDTFIASFEQASTNTFDDFVVYYGVQRDDVSVDLLTFRESSDQDGFFMMMIQPPSLTEERVLPKDVVIVLDQSGSMNGDKWEQAQKAAVYVLENLNENDRFNVVVFSSQARTYGNELLSARNAPAAINWVRSLYPEGGTNISEALTRAFTFADVERNLTVLFMTDGLATEGIVDTTSLITALNDAAPSNTRVFTFGVGYDVDTVLLDSVARDLSGSSSYVQPGERIDEAVAALYNRISFPVLTDVAISFDGVNAELIYPQQMPDLFAGEQLTLVGRYRQGGTATVTMTGKRAGQTQTLTYSDLSFGSTAGGNDFIARLWATRRIGDLLNQIRLNGESSELVESVVTLSLRYGIITPYTSFLITEDDILSAEGQAAAQEQFRQEANRLSTTTTGAGAVSAADMSSGMANAAQAPMAPPSPMATMTAPGAMGGAPSQSVMSEQEAAPSVNPLRYVQDKTFIQQGEVWTDTTFTPDTMTTRKVVFASDAYFDLLLTTPELAPYLAIGDHIIIIWNGEAIEIVTE